MLELEGAPTDPILKSEWNHAMRMAERFYIREINNTQKEQQQEVEELKETIEVLRKEFYAEISRVKEEQSAWKTRALTVISIGGFIAWFITVLPSIGKLIK